MSKKKTKSEADATAAARPPEANATPSFTILRVVQQLGKNGPMSMKALMEACHLSDRDNFVHASIWPALRQEYIQLLHPKSARHPFQKYLLTEKGQKCFEEEHL